jgi:hypothetical protein
MHRLQWLRKRQPPSCAPFLVRAPLLMVPSLPSSRSPSLQHFHLGKQKEALTVPKSGQRGGNSVDALIAVACMLHLSVTSPTRCTPPSQTPSACRFVYGEGHYAEVAGDSPTAYLPRAQLELASSLARIAADGRVPLIGIFIGGRDRLLAEFDVLFDAHLAAFYPGPWGGEAFARVLKGAVNPSARLPVTLHASDMQALPYWRSHADYTTAPPAVGYPRCASGCFVGNSPRQFNYSGQGTVPPPAFGVQSVRFVVSVASQLAM